MLGSITPLFAQGGGSSGGGSPFSLLVFFVLMGGIFYLLLIRPQQRQRRAQRQLIETLDVGDDVITISGIYGTVRELDDESITLEVSPGVNLKFVKGAVARKLVYDQDGDGAEGEEEEAGEQK